MERVVAILSHAGRVRINRIKELRKQETGIILSDNEVIVAALFLYWEQTEKRAKERQHNGQEKED